MANVRPGTATGVPLAIPGGACSTPRQARCPVTVPDATLPRSGTVHSTRGAYAGGRRGRRRWLAWRSGSVVDQGWRLSSANARGHFTPCRPRLRQAQLALDKSLAEPRHVNSAVLVICRHRVLLRQRGGGGTHHRCGRYFGDGRYRDRSRSSKIGCGMASLSNPAMDPPQRR